MKKLEMNEMEMIEGGAPTTQLEYCTTLYMILQNNDLSDGALAGAQYGWAYANCNEIPGEMLHQ